MSAKEQANYNKSTNFLLKNNKTHTVKVILLRII